MLDRITPVPDFFIGHVAATREQLLLQTQKLASRRSERPPKLPPRDNIYHPHDIPKPDYDDINEDDRFKAFRVKSDKGRDLNKKYGKRTHYNFVAHAWPACRRASIHKYFEAREFDRPRITQTIDFDRAQVNCIYATNAANQVIDKDKAKIEW